MLRKDVQKEVDRLNLRLKMDHSSFRFNAVMDYTTSYHITQCEVQYNKEGKERLVNVNVMFQYIEPEEVKRIFIAMTRAIDVLI